MPRFRTQGLTAELVVRQEGGGGGEGRWRAGLHGFAGEEFCPARFFLSGLPGQESHEGAGGPCGKVGENALGFGEVGNGAHAFGTRTKFGGGLRTAQQQFGEQSAGGGFDGELVVERLAKFGYAGVGSGKERGEAFFAQTVECLHHFAFREREHGGAVVALVAGIGQRIETQWVDVGRGEFLFDQTAEGARFRCVQEDIGHGGRGCALGRLGGGCGGHGAGCLGFVLTRTSLRREFSQGD